MLRLVRRFLGLIALVVVVLAAVFAWRLSEGPIDLDVLTPRLEAALSRPGGPVAVTVGGTTLEWERKTRDVVLRLRDVVVTANATGMRVGAVPALILRLGARPLLVGRIAIRRVTLLGPDVRLVRQENGTVDLGLGDGPAPVGDDLTLQQLADAVFGQRDGGSASLQLRGIGVEEGEIELVDLVSGRTWRLPRLDVSLRPEDGGVAGDARGIVALPGGDVPVAVTMRYAPDPGRVRLSIDVRDLVPARIDGAPPAAARIALPLSGMVDLTYDATLRLQHAGARLSGGAGTIDVAGTPLPVARLAGTMDMDVAGGVLTVDDVVAEIDGVTIGTRAKVANGAVEAEAKVSQLAVAKLPRWWPAGAADGARRWVLANVTAGQVRDVEARLSGTVQNGDPATFAPSSATGSASFDGLTVRYVDTMTPATAVGGTMTFGMDRLAFRVARGTVGGVEVVRATVDVPLGDATPPRVPISATVRGPVGATLAVLDKPPVELARTIGIAPADAKGTVNGTVTLGVPLTGRVTARALAVKVTADVRDGAAPRVLRGLPLSGANVSITRDDTTLAIRGPIQLAGVPATIAWQEDQTGTAATRRRIDVQARVDDAGWKALGVDLYGIVQGPVALKAGYVEPRTGSASATVDGDLAAAAVDLILLDLRKPAGHPGQVSAAVGLENGVPVDVSRLSLRAGGSRVEGRATRSDDGTRWLTADMTANVAPAAPGETAHTFTLALRPDGKRNRFTFTCDDAGAFFRGMGSTGDAEGGRLTATGTVDLAAAGPPFDAAIEVKQFTLTRQPIVTRVAQLVSLSGIVSSLSGGGLHFDRMACDLSQRGTILTLSNGVADGPSLAFTMRGTVDRGAKTVDMTGTLVPAYYGLNTAAGKIPVLGRLLTGGDKSGIQVFDFTARGPMGDPRVTANVSSLAPGVLRDLVRRLTR